MAAADDQPGCPGVAVLSYGFWQDHFGAAEGAVGGTISLDHHIFQIVGVSAPGFYGVEIGQNFDVAVPVCAAAIFDGKESRLEHRSWWWLRIIGRRKPGISVEQINARLGVISPEVSMARTRIVNDSRQERTTPGACGSRGTSRSGRRSRTVGRRCADDGCPAAARSAAHAESC